MLRGICWGAERRRRGDGTVDSHDDEMLYMMRDTTDAFFPAKYDNNTTEPGNPKVENVSSRTDLIYSKSLIQGNRRADTEMMTALRKRD
jgi:hypothetical protein